MGQKHTEALKSKWTEHREAMLNGKKKGVTTYVKRLATDPKFRNRISRIHSEASAKRWADPTLSAKTRKAQSEGAKRRWADPYKRAALLAARRTPKARSNLAAAVSLSETKKQAKRWRVPLKKLLAMTLQEKVLFIAELKKAEYKKNRGPHMLLVYTAERIGMPVKIYAALSPKERSIARNNFRKNKK